MLNKVEQPHALSNHVKNQLPLMKEYPSEASAFQIRFQIKYMTLVSLFIILVKVKSGIPWLSSIAVSFMLYTVET